jgi:GYF domain 2
MRERGGSMPAPGAPARVPAAGPAPDSRGGVQDRPGPVGVADAGAKAGGGWYYAEHGKATGPMEEGYLHVLVKGGQLGARSTLVWRQGMDGWLFYDEAFMRKEGGPERRRIPADAPALPTPRTLAAAAGLPVQGPAPGGRGRLSEQAASRRAFPFPGFGGLHTFFLSGTVAVGGCA